MTKAAPAVESVFTTRSERATRLLAKRLASTFKGDEVVFLIGELGAGKTVFAKGIAAGLGLKNTSQACSPTFTLINVYRARVPIWHLDLYRLGNRAEIRDLGFEDAIGGAVILIEWGERIDFPLDGIRVYIDVQPDESRKIRIERPGMSKRILRLSRKDGRRLLRISSREKFIPLDQAKKSLS